MTTSDRIPCCVPFCKRTASRAKFPDATEIICGKHYRLASAVLRRRRARLRRRAWRWRAGIDDEQLVRAWRLDVRLWDLIKTQAIERAAGIS